MFQRCWNGSNSSDDTSSRTSNGRRNVRAPVADTHTCWLRPILGQDAACKRGRYWNRGERDAVVTRVVPIVPAAAAPVVAAAGDGQPDAVETFQQVMSSMCGAADGPCPDVDQVDVAASADNADADPAATVPPALPPSVAAAGLAPRQLGSTAPDADVSPVAAPGKMLRTQHPGSDGAVPASQMPTSADLRQAASLQQVSPAAAVPGTTREAAVLPDDRGATVPPAAAGGQATAAAAVAAAADASGPEQVAVVSPAAAPAAGLPQVAQEAGRHLPAAGADQLPAERDSAGAVPADVVRFADVSPTSGRPLLQTLAAEKTSAGGDVPDADVPEPVAQAVDVSSARVGAVSPPQQPETAVSVSAQTEVRSRAEADVAAHPVQVGTVAGSAESVERGADPPAARAGGAATPLPQPPAVAAAHTVESGAETARTSTRAMEQLVRQITDALPETRPATVTVDLREIGFGRAQVTVGPAGVQVSGLPAAVESAVAERLERDGLLQAGEHSSGRQQDRSPSATPADTADEGPAQRSATDRQDRNTSARLGNYRTSTLSI